MNRREIFNATMNHKEAGRVLVDQGKQVGSIHKFAYDAIRETMGLPKGEHKILDRMSQCVHSEEDLLQAWNIDFRWLVPHWTQVQEIDETSYRNLFGILFKDSGHYFSIADAPLKGKPQEAMKDYPWPQTNDPAMFTGLKEQAQKWQKETDYVIGADGIKGGVFQTALELRGYDQFYMDLILDPGYMHNLLDIVLEKYKEMYTHYLTEIGEYVQIVYITDDFGSQNSLLMSPEMWREFLKPREGELIRHIKKLAPQAKLMFHTDGSVLPIIEEMVEIGVDILNPVQTSVEELSDTKALNDKVGDMVCFHGAMDVQQILVNATPQQIEEEVKMRMRTLGAGGGYIIATCHNINVDIPPENLKTMYEAIQKYGSYPF